jgi:hypothetical protein
MQTLSLEPANLLNVSPKEVKTSPPDSPENGYTRGDSDFENHIGFGAGRIYHSAACWCAETNFSSQSVSLG